MGQLEIHPTSLEAASRTRTLISQHHIAIFHRILSPYVQTSYCRSEDSFPMHSLTRAFHRSCSRNYDVIAYGLSDMMAATRFLSSLRKYSASLNQSRKSLSSLVNSLSYYFLSLPFTASASFSVRLAHQRPSVSTSPHKLLGPPTSSES
jgi:hypothetical protein